MLCTKKALVIALNSVFREGLLRLLVEHTGFASKGVPSLDHIERVDIRKSEPTLILADLGVDSDALARGICQLHSHFPGASVLVLSQSYSDEHFLTALRSGAGGYLLSDASCEVVVKSIELVALGERVVPGQGWRLLCKGHGAVSAPISAAIDVLSSREIDVLQFLSRGMSNKIIARQWGISEATVKVHVKAILRKVHARNRTEAALWAWDHGFIAPEKVANERDLNGHPAGVDARRA